MTRRKRRNSKQVCRSNLHHNKKHLYANDRYQAAFKKATSEASALQQQKKNENNQQSKSMGRYQTICKEINETDLDGDFDKRLLPTTIREAVADGRIGVSPLKKGRPRISPVQLTKALATHAYMLQVSASQGEESAANMGPLVKALTDGKRWEGNYQSIK